MKKLTTLAWLLQSVVGFAQKSTTINATIYGLAPGQTVTCRIYDASQQDSVKTLKNGFHFKLNIPHGEGNLYMLEIGGKYSENSTMLVYLDKGTVTIEGKGTDFNKEIKIHFGVPGQYHKK